MSETDRMVFTVHINATREAVWREITKTDEPQDAMWHTVLHSTGLEPGSAYQMRSPDGRTVNTIGEILVYDPPSTLQQTLRFTQNEDPFCKITHTIVDADGGGVEYTLSIDDLDPESKTGKGLAGGGGGAWIVKTVKKIVEEGQAGWSTRAMYKFFDVMGPRVEKKRTRVENWPMPG